VLNTLLKTAVDWGENERVPCTIRLLKVPKVSMGFCEFEDFERLVRGGEGCWSGGVSDPPIGR
jgi:hypothetical protein